MLSLSKTLTDWLTWTNTTVQDEWNTWEEWQRHQQLSHYERSDIFQYYLSRRPQFQPPKYSCLNGYNAKYYVYCFGDFATLLINPYGGSNATDYFSLLLDVYDVCKGRSRMITGDPSGIAILREIIMERSLNPLRNYDFNKVSYPYHLIHAHTVAQYSLSTLIMRLVSHYMSQTTIKGYYFEISTYVCQQTYDSCKFGTPIIASTSKATPPMNIIQTHTPKLEEARGFSWPRDKATCLRCKTCSRVTETIYGTFDACLDCHLKRICSVCGNRPLIISIDGLPKCELHQIQSKS